MIEETGNERPTHYLTQADLTSAMQPVKFGHDDGGKGLRTYCPHLLPVWAQIGHMTAAIPHSHDCSITQHCSQDPVGWRRAAPAKRARACLSMYLNRQDGGGGTCEESE